MKSASQTSVTCMFVPLAIDSLFSLQQTRGVSLLADKLVMADKLKNYLSLCQTDMVKKRN